MQIVGKCYRWRWWWRWQCQCNCPIYENAWNFEIAVIKTYNNLNEIDFEAFAWEHPTWNRLCWWLYQLYGNYAVSISYTQYLHRTLGDSHAFSSALQHSAELTLSPTTICMVNNREFYASFFKRMQFVQIGLCNSPIGSLVSLVRLLRSFSVCRCV